MRINKKILFTSVITLSLGFINQGFGQMYDRFFTLDSINNNVKLIHSKNIIGKDTLQQIGVLIEDNGRTILVDPINDVNGAHFLIESLSTQNPKKIVDKVLITNDNEFNIIGATSILQKSIPSIIHKDIHHLLVTKGVFQEVAIYDRELIIPILNNQMYVFSNGLNKIHSSFVYIPSGNILYMSNNPLWDEPILNSELSHDELTSYHQILLMLKNRFEIQKIVSNRNVYNDISILNNTITNIEAYMKKQSQVPAKPVIKKK